MAFLDHLGDRQRDAIIAILTVLNDDTWHTHQELAQAALNATDLAPKTVDELIRRAWRAQLYRRQTTTKTARATNATYKLRDRTPR